MRNIKMRSLVIALTVVVLAGATAYAVTNYGSQSDPLITKSYLDKVLQPKLEAELNTQLAAAEDQLRSSTPGEFTELSLSNGQTLRCNAGGEFLLRSGSAKALGSLADTTAGSSVSDGGNLSTNHLYMCAEDSGGLSASGSVTVLVSGSYSIG